jgi:glycosyltransferase involved in cell wall biosynthesis
VRRDDHVVAVTFRRNFGQTAAMAAGIDLAHGAVIVPMDGDLQTIRRTSARSSPSWTRVRRRPGWRKDRKDALSASSVPDGQLHHLASAGCRSRLRLLAQGLPERDAGRRAPLRRDAPLHPDLRPLARARVWRFRCDIAPGERGRHYGWTRAQGDPRSHRAQFFSAYITKPIYVFGGFGIFSIVLSLFTFPLSVVFKLIPRDNPWGPTWHKDFIATPLPVLSVGLFVVGLQMIFIGLLAEVLMRTYFESQNKRAYVIKSLERRGGRADDGPA